MPIDLNRIRERQLETKRREGGFFKCKEGKNIIRVFKFSHKVVDADVKAGYFLKGQLGKVMEEVDRPVKRQFNIEDKPIISNERTLKLYKDMLARDPKKAQDIRPNTSYYLNVVDINNEKDGVILYASPASVYNRIVAALDPDVHGEDILGSKGRDFVILFDKSKQGSDMYSTDLRKEGMSEELPDSLDKSVKDLYSPEAYAMMGKVETENPIEEDDNGKKETQKEAQEEQPIRKPSQVEEADPDLEAEINAVFGKKKSEPVFKDEEVSLDDKPASRKKR